jgi:hypothetical protein
MDYAHNPIVSIELKHHSIQQGSAKPLVDNLRADLEKAGSLTVPLIQVGLYTQIHSITPDAVREDFSQYRFINAYAYDKNGRLKINEAKMQNLLRAADTDLRQWSSDVGFRTPVYSFFGRFNSFRTSQGRHEVVGRVNYFIGMTTFHLSAIAETSI